jgi:hypothetical protein
MQYPEYLQENSSYGECFVLDLPCKWKEREERREALLNTTITVPETNTKLIAGIGVGMLLVFGVGVYLLFK